ncbi:hypothetical protein [Stenotrophomonas sp. 24(2023)]|uniref:hypothetical protein n=1 Tax=Stenotrophomonas sp. 24(2023) TaxID=3068324 RepID=UPI0027E19D06|nr:hypothetical protein [Stenotrophomonas sp. 24(2023)]WMJ69187.1 hypothetical protein Q9R17_18750 [Stenotrophomonas sp. 24(2023)]
MTFGLIQGGLYLCGYWGAFGLDPFQFAAVSEVALAGLASIGIVLVLMALGALLGGWIENRMSAVSSERKVLPWLLPSLVLVGLVAVIWWTGPLPPPGWVNHAHAPSCRVAPGFCLW